MKILIASFLSVLSLSAAACPTFNGTYACQGDGIEQTLTLSTSSVNGVTAYKVDGTEILADGTYRKIDYMGGQFDVAASCRGQTATLNIRLDGGKGDSEACGNQSWHLIYTTNWTPNGINITETHSGATVCADGKVVPEDMRGSMICIRK